jgi:tRNA(adenine34) deaminase
MTPQEKNDYENYMRQCIRLAYIAKSRGDSPVGSILVQNGKIIAEGIEGGKTTRDITFHAEIEAVRNAVVTLGKTDLSDCTMITTHEPCIMCSYVIRHHKIKRIIIGLIVPDVGGFSSDYPILKDTTISKWIPAPEVITNILEEECNRLKMVK